MFLKFSAGLIQGRVSFKDLRYLSKNLEKQDLLEKQVFYIYLFSQIKRKEKNRILTNPLDE